MPAAVLVSLVGLTGWPGALPALSPACYTDPTPARRDDDTRGPHYEYTDLG
jgi:hypothetical protein